MADIINFVLWAFIIVGGWWLFKVYADAFKTKDEKLIQVEMQRLRRRREAERRIRNVKRNPRG